MASEKVTGPIVLEYSHRVEVPAPNGTISNFYYPNPSIPVLALPFQTVMLTEQDWLNLDRPERLSVTIENADD